MSRARASALALVNWKGVFYERYLLDPHVTALEGANGAGKTSVMIAAYVVLLPDMSRLRFTNLGETAATGGDRGIWGRLGAAGRPSYAVLELELGGERVILGVHLERKAEPSVEPTAFIVTGLDRRHELSALLLLREGETEGVPLLSELRSAGAALGAHVEVFDTIREYFVALFERGITPLRLSNDDDRGKFNEMLRTSMTGGISRALTSELRLFLLKEEAGLSGTLSRMRENLEACRRTRLEVQEARGLEQEITGVYEAGLSMFVAALAAARERAREQAERRDRARAEHEAARFALLEIESEKHDLSAREEAAAARVAAARAAYETLRSRREGVLRAKNLQGRVAALELELGPEEQRSSEARRELELATERRDTERAALETARFACEQAARGLANLQTGLSELHRRAHAYRRGHASLLLSRELCGDASLDEDGLAAALERARSERERVDAERVRREREIHTAEQLRHDYEQAASALRELLGEPGAAISYEVARAELRRLDELDKKLAELALHSAALERARDDQQRQQALRERAREIGLEAAPGGFVALVESTTNEREAELLAAEEQAAGAFATRRNAEEEAARLRERIRALEGDAERYRTCLARADRLAPLLDAAPRTRAELLTGRIRVLESRESLRVSVLEARSRREALLAEAARFGKEDGAAEPELVELCEALGGELLATRFEDLDVSRAAWVEAELGPLASAIVVEDVDAAVAELSRVGSALPHVWLVRAGETVQPDTGEKAGGHAVSVPTEVGRRVSRLPERPALGRKAREARAKSLAADAERVASELEGRSSELRAIEGLLDDLDALLDDAALLEGPDPATTLAECRARLAELETLAVACAEAGAEQLARSAERKRELGRLRGLRAEAYLLDREDAASTVAALVAAVSEAEAARAELARVRDARRRLVEWCEALRRPPPPADELERFEREREALDAERDRWFRAVEALEAAIESRQARSYAGAEAALDESARLVPSLEAEQEQLAAAVNGAGQAVSAAESEWEQKALSFQAADARRSAVVAQLERAREELALAIERDGPPLDEARLEAEITEGASVVEAVEREVKALAQELGSLRERARQAESEAVEKLRAFERESANVGSFEQAYEALSQKAEKQQLLPARLGSELAQAGKPSAALLPEARSRREVLLDRLRHARAGQALSDELASVTGDPDEPGSFLETWRLVRDWLARRLPSQVADVEDPLRALDRLRDQLALLEERLARQELDLRGTSEDVARGIDVKLRRAAAQVRRLNQHLEGVSFGSIRGIRVEMQRLERMDGILKALREGEAQELLFQSALPVEEALDEIFRRYGGGKTGGQRLLDYREYLDLGVQVERKASAGFEAVSPTRLSTGEAIGVGAALMMVVLTEWERDANLFRNRKSEGTLRFLFLDEANRLSQDNLAVLFDLCQALDLQLLIAAPEVARASGNTTYRLVRRVSDDGVEEVIVSGRKALVEPVAASEPEAETEGYAHEESAELGDARAVGERHDSSSSAELD
jgi:chromosome partition protein MukB